MSRARSATRPIRRLARWSARRRGSSQSSSATTPGHRDLSLIFFGMVLGAISRRLSQSSYDPLLLQPNDVGPEHRFDAAILIGVDSDDPLIAALESRDIPLVGVDVRSPRGSTVYVGSDHAGGVRLALAHLHALGHRRIAHVAGATNTEAGAARLQAFQGGNGGARAGSAGGADPQGRLHLRVGLSRDVRAPRARRGRRRSSPPPT